MKWNKTLFWINTLLIIAFFMITVYNSALSQGEYFSTSRSYFLIFIFLTSVLGMIFEIYRAKEPSLFLTLGFLSYAIMAFFLWIEGATIV